jgi:ribosome-binding protein aMBF1 (putative translation factor)
MADNDNQNEWTTVVTKKRQSSKNKNAPVNPNAIQDWDRVIIHGKSASSTTIKKAIAPRYNFSPEAIKMQKIEAGEIIKPKILSIDARQELIKGRVAKGYNQEKLAQALAIPANLYKDIENGKTIPQHNILNKINNFLGTKAKLT